MAGSLRARSRPLVNGRQNQRRERCMLTPVRRDAGSGSARSCSCPCGSSRSDTVGLVVLRFVAFDATTALAVLNAQTRVGLPARVRRCVRRVVLPALRARRHRHDLGGVPRRRRRCQHRCRAGGARGRARRPALAGADRERAVHEPDARNGSRRNCCAADADIVLLQEVTPRWIEVLDAAGFASRYPYSARRIQLDDSRRAGGVLAPAARTTSRSPCRRTGRPSRRASTSTAPASRSSTSTRRARRRECAATTRASTA